MDNLEALRRIAANLDAIEANEAATVEDLAELERLRDEIMPLLEGLDRSDYDNPEWLTISARAFDVLVSMVARLSLDGDEPDPTDPRVQR